MGPGQSGPSSSATSVSGANGGSIGNRIDGETPLGVWIALGVLAVVTLGLGLYLMFRKNK